MRVLLLLPTTTYRTKAYIDAALRIGAEIAAASEIPSALESKNPSNLLSLNFHDPEEAGLKAAEFAALLGERYLRTLGAGGPLGLPFAAEEHATRARPPAA